MKRLHFTSVNRKTTCLFAGLCLLVNGSARADLTTGLIAYYDFEETGSTGLANKAPGPTVGDATWNGTQNLSTTGFTGDAAFNASDGLSDRGTLIVGNALNIVDTENTFIVAPCGSGPLGSTFTIAAWTYLAPGASNASGRFHAFEASNNWDVSWGTVSGDTFNMRSYVGQNQLTPDVPVTHETWQHVAHVFTSDGSTTTLTVYVDGEAEATGTVATGSMNFTALHFGDYRTGGSDRDWDGMIDEVAMWDRALTGLEVEELHDLGVAGDPITTPPSGFTWLNSTGGSWANPGDWTPAGPADGADQVAFINSLDITGDQTITLDGTYTIGTLRFADTAGADGNWILSPGSGGSLALSTPTSGSPGIIVSNQTTTVDAVLTGTQGMAKSGAGTLVLGAANTYSGGTLVSSGTVRIGNAAALPSGVGMGDVTLAGTLDMNDIIISINGLTGGGIVTNSGTGTPTLTVGDDDATASFGGVIENGGGTTSLIKTGAGTQSLTGNNTLSGTLTANGGTLVVGGLLRNISGITANSATTVELGANNMFVAGHNYTVDDTRVISVDGGVLFMNTAMQSRIGNISLANGAVWTIDRNLDAWDVLLADTTAGAATVAVANSGGNTGASIMDGIGGLHLQHMQNFDVDDVTGDAGEDLYVSLILADAGYVSGAAGGVNKLGTGTLLLDGPNTYTGDTIINSGTMELGEFGDLSFEIGANGVNNKVTGAGTAIINGYFHLDLSGADTTTGNTWTLVDATTKSFDSTTFNLYDFTESPEGVHSFVDGSSTWTFTEATGTLTVTTTVSDYITWIDGFTFAPGADKTPAGDPDNDGLANEEEYAFGLAPNSGSSVNPVAVQLDKTDGTFTYTRRDDALTTLSYKVWTSTDLATWTEDSAATQDDSAGPDSDGVEPVVVTLGTPKPLTAPELFVRVTAE